MEKLTVVIATYNSEKTLEKVLIALRNQTYPQEYIEILLIDGGSTDATLELGHKYGCIVIDNPKTEPVHAKLIGVREATGRYLMTLDHDEVLENRDSIKLRINELQAHPECKVAFCSGYKRPEDYPLLNQYISEFGDPFSMYMYNFSKDWKFYEKALKRCCAVVDESETYVKYSLQHLRKSIIVELCCLATIIDLQYFKRELHIDENEKKMVHAFYYMLEHGEYDVLLTKNDPLVHYSVDSLKAYFPKLKWRVCNNVHFAEKGENGFEGRQKYMKVTPLKKYGFIFYSFLVPISFVHALALAISRRNIVYLLHPLLCLYVSLEIVWQMMLKVMGITPQFKSYDGRKKIAR